MDVINELAPAQIALDTFFESTRSGMKQPLALRVAARDVLQGTFEAGSREEALAIGATLLWAAIEGQRPTAFARHTRRFFSVGWTT